MTATSALIRGQARAATLMVDACTVTRLVPDPSGATTNPESGVVTPAYTTIYTGACKIQEDRSTVARPEVIGEATRWFSRLQLHVPVTSTTAAITSDDIVTITASVHDPSLAGTVFHVREVAPKSWPTAYRFGIEEVTS